VEVGPLRVTDVVLHGPGSVRPVCLCDEIEYTYQTVCKGRELVASVEVLLSKNVYKSESTLEWDGQVLRPTPQTHDSVPRGVGDIQDRVESVK